MKKIITNYFIEYCREHYCGYIVVWGNPGVPPIWIILYMNNLLISRFNYTSNVLQIMKIILQKEQEKDYNNLFYRILWRTL